MFGVTARRIEQLTADGVISSVQVEGKRGRQYEKDETIKTYIKYLSDKANGKAASKTETELKEQKLKVEIALKESQRDLHILRTDQEAVIQKVMIHLEIGCLMYLIHIQLPVHQGHMNIMLNR